MRVPDSRMKIAVQTVIRSKSDKSKINDCAIVKTG